jgi:hypothetical protein
MNRGFGFLNGFELSLNPALWRGFPFLGEKMKIIFMTGLLLKIMILSAQVVPLKAEEWVFRPGSVEFGDSAGMARMKILRSDGHVVLRRGDFSDGTIEFDVVPTDPGFSQFDFRWQDSTETECFYFRTARGVGHPYVMEAVQYTPIVKGTMFWDIMAHYQGNASFGQGAPNHVKLVISGRRMLVYVNGGAAARPTLDIGELEGNTTHGSIAFSGQAIISNLVLKPGKVEGLSPIAATDPTANDPRYLRHWQMTTPDTLAPGIDFSYRLMPGKETGWQPIDAERRGLINLTRKWVVNRTHQLIWLKTTIHAESAGRYTLRLGFVDEVWMFLNGGLLYADKNFYGSPIAKTPRGRLSLENAMVTLPLQQGDNVLMVAVGSNFYGWAIMARLDDQDGLTIERTADGR